jgi:hypothetical protein
MLKNAKSKQRREQLESNHYLKLIKQQQEAKEARPPKKLSASILVNYQTPAGWKSKKYMELFDPHKKKEADECSEDEVVVDKAGRVRKQSTTFYNFKPVVKPQTMPDKLSTLLELINAPKHEKSSKIPGLFMHDKSLRNFNKAMHDRTEINNKMVQNAHRNKR